MGKDRDFKIIAIVALVFAVAGLSIAYAGYTTALNVSGTGEISGGSWDVHFTNLKTATTTGQADVSAANFQINGTSASGFLGSLNVPGDSITYTFDVTNSGKLDAVLTSLTKGTLTCAPSSTNGSTADEATNVCNDLVFTLNYAGAEATNLSSVADKNLTKDTSKTISITLTWSSDSTVTASGKVDITMSATDFDFAQAS